MRKLFTLFLFSIFLIGNIFSQVPNNFTYQLIVRDNDGSLLANKDLGVKLTLFQGKNIEVANEVYSETFSVLTNENALATITTGSGTTTDSISNIKWVDYFFHIKIEIDPENGVDYTIEYINDFKSVPYALVAKMIIGKNINESQISDLQDYYLASNPDGFISSVTVTKDDVFEFKDSIQITESQITDLKNYISNDSLSIALLLASSNDASLNKITNLADPTDSSDIATKAYVDSVKFKYLDVIVQLGLLDERDTTEYEIVRVGHQIWMAENLNYETALGSWCYGNDTANCSIYGRLYNWGAIMNGESASATNPSGVRGICPEGWHVPSHAEWTQLVNYLNSREKYWCNGISTNIAKAISSNSGWNNSTTVCRVGNNQATTNNITGMNILPAGFYNFGSFGGLGAQLWTWSSTNDIFSSLHAYVWSYYNTSTTISGSGVDKDMGFPLRCVRD